MRERLDADNNKIESILLKIKSDNLSIQGLGALISGLSKIKEEKEKNSQEARKPQNSKDEVEAVETNAFGFPDTWPKEISIKYMRQVQEDAKRTANASAINREIRKIFEDINAEYQKYASEPIDYRSSEMIMSREILTYLSLPQDEKLQFIKKAFPKGLRISDRDIFAPWEKVLPYELWAIKNHGQTLFTLNTRGGVSLMEFLAIYHGVNNDATKKYDNQKPSILKWIETLDK